MKILNKIDEEITEADCDLTLGYLKLEQHVTVHHEATDEVAYVPEVGHWEVIQEYENGGKDVEWVIDEPGVAAQPAQEAWDEYEDILRYVQYTDEELAAIEEERKLHPTVEDMIDKLNVKIDKICKLLNISLDDEEDAEESDTVVAE